jgi:glucose-6-phosphate 1-dehydrogenase
VGKEGSRNRLDIILQGEAGMKLYLQTKLGGSEPKFRPLVMEDPLVCMGDCLVEHSLLLLEAINGNQQWFLDPEEVRTCWRLIDPVQTYLDEKTTPLAVYESGIKGPKEADEFIAKFGHTWL